MRSFLTTWRTAVWLALGLAISTPPTAMAQSAPDRKVQAAYELAMKCFVANGFVENRQLDAHDQAGAEAAKEREKAAFDMAVQLGKQLDYNNERINRDLDLFQQRELPRMVRDSEYFRQTEASCKAYGLM